MVLQDSSNAMSARSEIPIPNHQVHVDNGWIQPPRVNLLMNRFRKQGLIVHQPLRKLLRSH